MPNVTRRAWASRLSVAAARLAAAQHGRKLQHRERRDVRKCWVPNTKAPKRSPRGFSFAPHSALFANPFAGLSAGRVRSARTVPDMRMPANPAGCEQRAGTLSVIRTVPRRRRAPLAAARFASRMGPRRPRPPGGGDKSPSFAHRLKAICLEVGGLEEDRGRDRGLPNGPRHRIFLTV